MLRFHHSLVLLSIGVLVVGWWLGVAKNVATDTTTYLWGDILSGQTQQDRSVSSSKQSTSTRIVFTGDVFLGRDVEDSAKQYGYDYPLAIFTKPPFASTSATVINFEAPIPAVHITTPDFSTRFSVASSAVPAIRSAGITHVGLANNHTTDFGVDGLAHTRDVFAAAGVKTFGNPSRLATSSIAFIDTVQGPVAVIAIHALYNPPDIGALQNLLTSLPIEVVASVAYVHWGREYEEQASYGQKELATELAEAGIDLIIGHHSHVVQNISQVNGIPVLYSLGNTVFDQYFSAPVQNGLIVTLEFTPTNRFIHLYPISSFGSRTRPYLMPLRERELFLRDVSQRSDARLTEQIVAGTLVW